MCHGADGIGGKWGRKALHPGAELTETISKGKPPKMPAYEGKLKEKEAGIKDLVAHVRSLGL